MTLSDYIRETGVAEFAKRFKITERAATAYLYGARSPRPPLAKRIVERTPVDWDGVYAGALKPTKRQAAN
jgi:hypothetical protein